MDNPEFDEISRKLDHIFDSNDEELIQVLEDIVDEAEAIANGLNLPADWILRPTTRLRAVQAKCHSCKN